MISVVIQFRACWHHLQEAPPGLNQKWETSDQLAFFLTKHLDHDKHLVLIMFVRLEVAGTGLGPLLWEDLSSHLPFLGLKTGLVTEGQGSAETTRPDISESRAGGPASDRDGLEFEQDPLLGSPQP